jgi:acyl-CoA thioesterase FadM
VVAAEGDSTVVMFDYEQQQPVPISTKVRASIESLENRAFS